MATDDTNKKVTAVIFSRSPADRDYLRAHLAIQGVTVLCFEKETTCFDNLVSIHPDCIILLTDAKRIVWRFLFAIHVLNIDSRIWVVSDSLQGEIFDQHFYQDTVRCMPHGRLADELTAALDVLTNSMIQKIGNGCHYSLFVGESEKIKAIRSLVFNLEAGSDPIMITGEPGTGKELLARMIASHMDKGCLFIKYDCTALKPEMVSRFRIKGITHRGNCAVGRETRPRSAVILLDRIDRLDRTTQSEMLLLLDDVGKIIPAQFLEDMQKIRYIATTEINLESSLSTGAFRKDLYYRLNVLPINIPPLRNRKEDIPLLADFFSIEACAKSQKSYEMLSAKTKERLCCHEWPNNVRELKTLVQRICLNGNASDVFSQNGIPDLNNDLRESLFYTFDAGVLPDALEIRNHLSNGENTSLKSICATFITRAEKQLVQKALEKTKWNRKRAASLLNISYKSMLNKMKMYEIV